MRRGTVILGVCLAAVACKKSTTRAAPIAAASTVITANLTAGEQAVVTASHGQVEVVREGTVSAAKVGDRLGVKDALQTQIGEADVAVEGVKLRLHEASRLELKQVEKRAMLARMRGGIESEVDQNARLDMEMEGSDAVAHSQGGHFFITADGRGVVAVATVTGTVHLYSAGATVDVNKGEVSRVMAENALPSQPAAALRRVLLSVQWPDRKETNQPSVPIAGKVEPGSRVFVQGQPVAVEAGGTFRAQVPLKQGKQKIAVVTVDALGRRKQVEGVVLRDDSLPQAKVKKKLWQWH